MSCSPFSSRRLLLTVTVAALLLGACGSDEDETGGSDTTTTAVATDGTRSPPPLDPGPAEVGDVVEDELAVVTHPDDPYVVDAVARAGGDVVSTDDQLGILRVRFDVAGVAELLRIRDELRAAGVDARVIPALDPGDLGTGSPDDPA